MCASNSSLQQRGRGPSAHARENVCVCVCVGGGAHSVDFRVCVWGEGVYQ